MFLHGETHIASILLHCMAGYRLCSTPYVWMLSSQDPSPYYALIMHPSSPFHVQFLSTPSPPSHPSSLSRHSPSGQEHINADLPFTKPCPLTMKIQALYTHIALPPHAVFRPLGHVCSPGCLQECPRFIKGQNKAWLSSNSCESLCVTLSHSACTDWSDSLLGSWPYNSCSTGGQGETQKK